MRVASGTINGFALPTLGAGHNNGMMQTMDSTVSPNGGITLEVTISKCKGVIGSAAADGACYKSYSNTYWNSLSWANGPLASIPSQYLSLYEICPAFTSQGPWYVNLRYTYSACNYGTCGFNIQWFDGGVE